MWRRKRGFTLIELMIVITIIAVLAAILVPNFKRARARSQLSACVSQCKTTATALEMYAVDNDGRFPDIASGLAGLSVLTQGSYLKRLPTCPSRGTCTFLDYVATTTPDRFSFSCVGNNHGDCFPGLNGLGIPSYSNDTGPTQEPPP